MDAEVGAGRDDAVLVEPRRAEPGAWDVIYRGEVGAAPLDLYQGRLDLGRRAAHPPERGDVDLIGPRQVIPDLPLEPPHELGILGVVVDYLEGHVQAARLRGLRRVAQVAERDELFVEDVRADPEAVERRVRVQQPLSLLGRPGPECARAEDGIEALARADLQPVPERLRVAERLAATEEDYLDVALRRDSVH